MTYSALDIATILHAGQVDKAGVNYIEHPIGVAASLSKMPGWSDFAPAQQGVMHDAALLHDTLEDTSMTEEGLLLLGISGAVTNIVRLLTRTPKVSRDDYYLFIRENEMAKFVKHADIFHNLSRLSHLDTLTQMKLTQKYSHALEVLNG